MARDTVRLVRRVDFEASHRLRVHSLSEAENRERFGRECDLHGHNWALCVGFEGRSTP